MSMATLNQKVALVTGAAFLGTSGFQGVAEVVRPGRFERPTYRFVDSIECNLVQLRDAS
jgi:hypothetical protein